MTGPPRVLVFAEDPGAVAFLAGFEEGLAAAGMDPVPLVAGTAAAQRPDAVRAASDNAAALIARHQPAALVVGTSENTASAAFALVAAARAGGIPSFGAVDSAANAAHRFAGTTGDPLAHAPDHLLVPDRATAAAFAALGVAPARIHTVGHPRFAELAARRGAAPTVPRAALFPDAGARPVIVFIAELSTGLGAEGYHRTRDYTLAGTSGSDRRTDIVGEELVRAARAARAALPPWLVLRLHPKQDQADVADLAALFDQVSKDEPGLALVEAADLVVGMTSILLVEAALIGRPVLSVVPRAAESAWLGDHGALIPAASTRPALEAALRHWPGPCPAPAGSHRANPAAQMAAIVVDHVAATRPHSRVLTAAPRHSSTRAGND